MEMENKNLVVVAVVWGHMDSLRLYPFAFCMQLCGKSYGSHQGIRDADIADKVWHLPFVCVSMQFGDILQS